VLKWRCSVEKANLVPLSLTLFVVDVSLRRSQKWIIESSRLKRSYVGCTVRFAPYSWEICTNDGRFCGTKPT
jgi:hypothetical protein